MSHELYRRAVLFFLLLAFILSVAPAMVLGANPGGMQVRSVGIIDKDQEGRPLSYPSTIFYDEYEDELYITDAGKGQIVVCTSDDFPFLGIGSGRGLEAVFSVLVYRDKLFVGLGAGKGESGGHIEVFNQALLPVGKIFFSGFKGADSFIPRKMVAGHNGNLYVVGVNSAEVVVVDSQGKYLRSIVPKDEVLGVLEDSSVYSLAVDKDGRLYFLSEARGRVYVYDKDEKFLYKFGQKGGDTGKLARPRGIAVDDRNDRIYIVDYLRHAVSIYSKEGKYLSEFGGKGYGRGWFFYPTDVCIDGRGRILVTDTFNNRVQVFKPVGLSDEGSTESTK